MSQDEPSANGESESQATDAVAQADTLGQADTAEQDSPSNAESTVTDAQGDSSNAQDPTGQDPTGQDTAVQGEAAQAEPIQDADLDAAKAAWDGETAAKSTSESDSGSGEAVLSEEEVQRASELAEPFVGQWNKLISTTNWEKGRIVSQWRSELIESGVDATQYSDEAWSRRVGGVTAPHVGRLRRVFERFNDTYQSYEGLYWSHFLAALDWEDAPMWLEGASNESWSISQMREKRWQAEGAVDGKRPTDSQIVEVDTDEDITEPAQGGGKNREYDNDSGEVAAGAKYEAPDFGEEGELQSLAGQGADGASGVQAEGEPGEPAVAPIQPFIGLPSLPDDLGEAIESLKLSILRHKATDWQEVEVEIVEKYLHAIGVMIRS